jgi:hypothetical protein
MMERLAIWAQHLQKLLTIALEGQHAVVTAKKVAAPLIELVGTGRWQE